MDRLVLPNDAFEKLRPLDRYFQVCDQTGRVLGYSAPAVDQPLQSPLSDAELQRRLDDPQRLTTQQLLEHWEKLG